MPARPLPRGVLAHVANHFQASAIPRALSAAERRERSLPAEIAPSALAAAVRPDLAVAGQRVPESAAACRALRDRIGEHVLAAYLLTHGDRPALKRLAASVQAEHPRTAPADKRSSHELVSYITRMLTAGRYIAAFED